MSLRISHRELDRIHEESRKAYPYECCGALLGRAQNSRKEVADILPLQNHRDDSPRNRFLITAEDWKAAEAETRKRGLELIGFYHSHPDHPAWPSVFDREHAWPWYSYVIVAVNEGIPGEATSWTLAEDRASFEPETIALLQASARN